MDCYIIMRNHFYRIYSGIIATMVPLLVYIMGSVPLEA